MGRRDADIRVAKQLGDRSNGDAGLHHPRSAAMAEVVDPKIGYPGPLARSHATATCGEQHIVGGAGRTGRIACSLAGLMVGLTVPDDHGHAARRAVRLR